MFETILTVALLSGAQQVDNTVILDKEVIIRVQEKTGYNVFLIEDNAHYKVKKRPVNLCFRASWTGS